MAKVQILKSGPVETGLTGPAATSLAGVMFSVCRKDMYRKSPRSDNLER